MFARRGGKWTINSASLNAPRMWTTRAGSRCDVRAVYRGESQHLRRVDRSVGASGRCPLQRRRRRAGFDECPRGATEVVTRGAACRSERVARAPAHAPTRAHAGEALPRDVRRPADNLSTGAAPPRRAAYRPGDLSRCRATQSPPPRRRVKPSRRATQTDRTTNSRRDNVYRV